MSRRELTERENKYSDQSDRLKIKTNKCTYHQTTPVRIILNASIGRPQQDPQANGGDQQTQEYVNDQKGSRPFRVEDVQRI